MDGGSLSWLFQSFPDGSGRGSFLAFPVCLIHSRMTLGLWQSQYFFLEQLEALLRWQLQRQDLTLGITLDIQRCSVNFSRSELLSLCRKEE